MKLDSVYIQHIEEALGNISEYTNGVSRESFLSNGQLKDAVVRNIEVLGEAVKHVSADMQAKYESIPWKKIARTRDMLIHHYFDVDDEELWNIVEKDIPSLIVSIVTLKESEGIK